RHRRRGLRHPGWLAVPRARQGAERGRRSACRRRPGDRAVYRGPPRRQGARDPHPAAATRGRRSVTRYSSSPAVVTRLQWIYVIMGLVVALSMILAVLPIGR